VIAVLAGRLGIVRPAARYTVRVTVTCTAPPGWSPPRLTDTAALAQPVRDAVSAVLA